MTVRLVSSKSTKRKISVVDRNPQLSDFVCLDWHHESLRNASAILVDVENKIALLATFNNKESRHMFIQNLYFYTLDDICPEMALAAEALSRGIRMGGRCLYVEQFPNETALFLTHTGIKRLLFKEGDMYPETVEIFKKNNVKIIRIDA